MVRAQSTAPRVYRSTVYICIYIHITNFVAKVNPTVGAGPLDRNRAMERVRATIRTNERSIRINPYLSVGISRGNTGKKEHGCEINVTFSKRDISSRRSPPPPSSDRMMRAPPKGENRSRKKFMWINDKLGSCGSSEEKKKRKEKCA